MNPALAAAAGQAAALRLMTDACRIYRLDRDHPTPGAGGRDAYPETDVYAGPCRFRPESPADGGGTPAIAGKSPVVATNGLLSVPMTVTGVHTGDLVEVTAAADPELATRTLKVVDVIAGSQITARRIRCVDVTP